MFGIAWPPKAAIKNIEKYVDAPTIKGRLKTEIEAKKLKTYFVKEEFQKRKQLYIGLPIFCFVIGLVLYLFGNSCFMCLMS